VKSDFIGLLERLGKAGIDFVIVGGFAGVVHGCSYVTQDVDICLAFSMENLLKLQDALSDVHPVHRMTRGRNTLELTEENCSRFRNLYLDTDVGRLDCLSFIDGVGDYAKVRQAGEVIEVAGMQLRVLGLEGLLEAKRAMGRPRDKEAILQLEAIRKLREKK